MAENKGTNRPSKESVQGSGTKEARNTVIAQSLPIKPASDPAKAVEPTTSLVDTPPASGTTDNSSNS